MRTRKVLMVFAVGAGLCLAMVQPASARTQPDPVVAHPDLAVGGQVTLAVSATQVQWDLAGLGYLAFGDIDGIIGTKTTAAVKAFQSNRCLDVDGVVGTETSAALVALVTKVQQVAGANPDGMYGPATQAAVKTWQGAHGLTQNGQADAATMAAMGIARVLNCTPPTSGELATKIVQIARQEAANTAHNHEKGGYNCNYYTTALGLAGTGAYCSNGWKTQAWCADFSKWVWVQAGAATAGLNSMYNSFQTYGTNHGTWHTGNPKPGDAIVFDFGHVGLVTAVTSTSVTYVSGNTYHAADGADDALLEKTVSRSYSEIRGYASPVAR